MIISQIVAVAKGGVIGDGEKMLWRLPADFRYFKEKTMGHHMLMGRKTYETLGKALPGRTSVVVTRQHGYTAEGCIVVDSIEKGVELAEKAGETELFVIGGGEIYRLMMDKTDIIYLTFIELEVEGSVVFPLPDEREWEEVRRIDFPADEKNPYNYSFTEWHKRK